MFVLTTQNKGTQLYDGSLKVLPARKLEKERRIFTAQDGGKSVVYLMLIKNGNVWRIPFNTDQVSGIFVVTRPCKDAGL